MFIEEMADYKLRQPLVRHAAGFIYTGWELSILSLNSLSLNSLSLNSLNSKRLPKILQEFSKSVFTAICKLSIIVSISCLLFLNSGIANDSAETIKVDPFYDNPSIESIYSTSNMILIYIDFGHVDYAEKLFNSIIDIEPSSYEIDGIKAQAIFSIIFGFIKNKELEKALFVYEKFDSLVKRDDILATKLRAAFNIISYATKIEPTADVSNLFYEWPVDSNQGESRALFVVAFVDLVGQYLARENMNGALAIYNHAKHFDCYLDVRLGLYRAAMMLLEYSQEKDISIGQHRITLRDDVEKYTLGDVVGRPNEKF